jgi:hypothetical protein
MAETPFPIPKTSTFQPDAWDTTSTVSAEEISFLDNYFVRFPTTQSTPITFPVSPTLPTLPIGTGDARAASAQFVQNAKNTRTWGALQTFNAGMVSSAIDPTTVGGTLAIGNGAVTNVVNIMTASNTGTLSLGSSGSTISLNTSLTPNYTYPVAAGKVGFTTTVTAVNVAAVQNASATLLSISLPKGIWFVSFTAGLTTTTTGFFNLGISELSNSLVGARGQSSFTGATPIPPTNTATTVLSHNDVVNKTYYGVALYSLTGGTWTGIEMYATRLA